MPCKVIAQNDKCYAFDPLPATLPVTFEGKVVATARLNNAEYTYSLPGELAVLLKRRDLLTQFVPEPIYFDKESGFATRWATVAIRLSRSLPHVPKVPVGVRPSAFTKPRGVRKLVLL